MFDDAAYQKQYYADNKERIKARVRAWEIANPARRAEHAKKARLTRPGFLEKARLNSLHWEARNPDKALLAGARRRARKYGVEFNLDISDIVIPEFCPVLGVPLVLIRGRGGSNRMNQASPSLDRIDPRKGYTKGNVWVISWKANRLKCDATPDELLLFAKAMLRLFED